MNVLVAAASRHGGTWELAGWIAAGLREHGLVVSLVRLDHGTEQPDPSDFDAVVLGSAVYTGRWLEPARHFAARHAAALADRPVWLFSSGPIGEPPHPSADRAVELDDGLPGIGAEEHRVFGGRLDRASLGFAERAVVAALRVADSDARDPAAVREWATGIAAALTSPPLSSNRT